MQESCWARHLYAWLAPLNEAAPTTQRRPPGPALRTSRHPTLPNEPHRPLKAPPPPTSSNKRSLALSWATAPPTARPRRVGTNRSQLAVLTQPQEKEMGDLGVVSDRGRGGGLWPQGLVQGVHYQPLPRRPISNHLPQFLKDASGLVLGWQRADVQGRLSFPSSSLPKFLWAPPPRRQDTSLQRPPWDSQNWCARA